MLRTYVTDTLTAWREWLADSAITFAAGCALNLIPDFKLPWYAYVCLGAVALLPAGYNTWRKQRGEVLELRALRDAPGLQFVCEEGPPYHDIVGDKRRPTFSLGIRNSSPFTRRNVRLEILSINQAPGSQIPIRLRVQHLGTEAADIQPGQMTCFAVAKIVPKKGLLFCRFRTNELPEIDHGTYTLRVAVYADDLSHREALVRISSSPMAISGSLVDQGPGPYDLPTGEASARMVRVPVNAAPTGTFGAQVVTTATISALTSIPLEVLLTSTADFTDFPLDAPPGGRPRPAARIPVGVRQSASTVSALSSLDIATTLTGTAIARNVDNSPPNFNGLYMKLREASPEEAKPNAKPPAVEADHPPFGGEAPFPSKQ